MYDCVYQFMTMFVYVWLCMTMFDYVLLWMTMWRGNMQKIKEKYVLLDNRRITKTKFVHRCVSWPNFNKVIGIISLKCFIKSENLLNFKNLKQLENILRRMIFVHILPIVPIFSIFPNVYNILRKTQKWWMWELYKASQSQCFLTLNPSKEVLLWVSH